MGLTASDLLTYHRPSMCERRIYLRARGEPEEPPGPFDETLKRLGIAHEQAHLATFEEVLDLGAMPLPERIGRTREAVENGHPLIYQGALEATLRLGREDIRVSGVPDFLICQGHGHLIRDSKLSRRITEDDHPEILAQLQLYGLLFERTFGEAPAGLQVHSGTGEIIDVAYDRAQTVLPLLQQILKFKRLDSEPYSPVGWTKCGGCGFHKHCMDRATADHDVALVAGVDQNLARALRDVGVSSRADLLNAFDENRLSEFNRPWGKTMQRVGFAAPKILRMARAMEENTLTLLQPPDLPEHSNYVMFDLEGMPPYLDELDKIYLWGMKVLGDRPSPFLYATAGFGPDGDREGWEKFLGVADEILQRYGDVRFVHWSAYEKTQLVKYVNRFGDPNGTAERVHRNLLDLYRVTHDSVILPLPSYSLKVIEQYIGFKRTQEEYGGEWAMAKYIEATETRDESKRTEFINQILKYNEEDLNATWAVFEWLRGLS